MDLREYARVLFKRGWIIILVAIVGALGALLFSRLQTPIYSSNIRLRAQPSRPADWGQSQAIKNLLLQYSEQIQTVSSAQQVIDQLQLDVTPQNLLGRVNVAAHEDNLTLEIQARDPIMENAPKIAQALAENFVVLHQQENLEIDQQDRVLVSLLDNAGPPEKFSPKTTINVIAGAILGGLAGAIAVFLLEYLQSGYIRKPEDVERALNLTVLGTIPTMRTKDVTAKSRPAVQPQTTNVTSGT